MRFYAVAVTVSFDGHSPVELTTTEETMQPITRPRESPSRWWRLSSTGNGTWCASACSRRPPGARQGAGEPLDEITVPLGGTATATKLGENFSVRVTRAGSRTAR